MRIGLLVFGLVIACAPAPRAEAFACADLALVLAFDSSASISDEEFALQTRGTALAFQDLEVKAALAAAGTVAVAVVVWGDAASGIDVLDWDVIRSPADADRFAGLVDGLARSIGGSTDLGNGLGAALDMLEDPRICATRRVVNVSGDGRESLAPRRRTTPNVWAARSRAEDLGVTVNGLAVISDDADVVEFYRDRLITGPGSFVVEAPDFGAFAEAIRRKLVREIDLPSIADVDPPAAGKALIAPPGRDPA